MYHDQPDRGGDEHPDEPQVSPAGEGGDELKSGIAEAVVLRTNMMEPYADDRADDQGC